MSRKRFVPVDVLQLIETQEIREMNGADFAIEMSNYANMGVIVTSERKCDDGALVSSTLWLPGLTGLDAHYIHMSYNGFEEPSWPAWPHDPRH